MSVEGLIRWGNRHAGKIREVGGPNQTVIWDWFRSIYGYGLQGQSWCGAADCVSLTWGAGWQPPADWTGVYFIEKWGRDNGRYHDGVAGVEAGDALILIAHNQHTGIARGKPRLGMIPTFEGNTSSGYVGSQYNGDGYYRRLRPTFLVVGYVRIHDLLDKAATPIHQPDFTLAPLPLRVDGGKGPQTIGHLQKAIGDVVDGYDAANTRRLLKKHLNAKLKLKGKSALNVADQHFAPRSVRALQRYLGVKPTGVWGGRTTKALQQKLNERKF